MPLHLLDGHFEERPISAQSYLRGRYRAGLGKVAVETIGSKRSYARTWCMPNNDDDDEDDDDDRQRRKSITTVQCSTVIIIIVY